MIKSKRDAVKAKREAVRMAGGEAKFMALSIPARIRLIHQAHTLLTKTTT